MLSELRIHDSQGNAAPRRDGAWVLDEAVAYTLRAPGGPYQASLAGRPIPWDKSLGGLRLVLPMAVGRMDLDLARAEERWTLPLQVRPAGHKLDEADWQALLGDLEGWLPGLTAGAEGPRVGQVGLVGVAAPLLAEALLPLIPPLVRALRALLEAPRQRVRDQLQEIPLHRTRAADRETTAWLSAHPRDAIWLDPVRSLELGGPPPTLPHRTTQDTLDHPANQHVAWLLLRVIRRLHETATALRRVTGSQLTDTSAWAEARAQALLDAAQHIERLHRRSFLRALRPAPASESAMLVVMDQPLYARVHRLCRRLIAARFQLEPGPESAATRPSFDLYELWCFLAVKRALEGALGPGFHWQAAGLRHLLRLDSHGTGAVLSASDGASMLRVLFNPRFPSALQRLRGRGPRSISAERRPDIVLTWASREHRRWLVLDAKYRVGAQSLGQALESAHIYRDALRWPAFGGRCEGAWLLAPRRTRGARVWFREDFHDEHGLGVLELRPGSAPPPVTPQRLTRFLTA
ncbi:MAG: DUF2357 domain-containing protein [Pseudomonadota bacterium]